tara:strand:- start:965 stop:1969 length:1005 start_codon:yes stop_codon:yes gene_type:complete
MKTLTKVGLSALAGALAVTSANAGDVAMSGSMVVSYSKGSGYHTTGSPLGMDKELSVTGSGELDNGTTVSYKQTITDAMAFNDSEIVFGNVMGTTATLAMTSTGDPMSAIDDVTPTAFEEANAVTGSIKDVNGIDGAYSLRLTQADIMGSGFTFDAGYTWKHGAGDAATEKGSSGDAGVAANKDGYSVVVKGAVPMLEGLDVGAGYAKLNTTDLTTGEKGQEEGTAYVKYASGPISVGYQRGVVEVTAAAKNQYVNEYIGVSYKVSDNLSVSYNEAESRKSTDSTDQTQDWDSISLSYTVGGMTLGVVQQEVDNATYTSGRTSEETAIQMTVAF